MNLPSPGTEVAYTSNTETVIDVKAIFKQLFGYTPMMIAGLPVQPGALPPAQITPITKKTTNLYGEPLYGQADMLGHQAFCPVTITVNGVDYLFPYCVMGISRTKKVVKTEMTELDGTVKEIISNSDFDITIKGFLLGNYEQFPDTQLKALNDAFTFNNTVNLKSAFSDIFLHANDSVLIEEMDIPEKGAVIGVRDFSLKMVSDGIFTLYQS